MIFNQAFQISNFLIVDELFHLVLVILCLFTTYYSAQMPKKARSTSKRNKKPKFRGIPSCKTTRNEVNELEHFSEDTEEIQVQVPQQQASLTSSTEESQPISSRMEQQQSLMEQQQSSETKQIFQSF